MNQHVDRSAGPEAKASNLPSPAAALLSVRPRALNWLAALALLAATSVGGHAQSIFGAQAVSSTSPGQTVLVTATSGGTVSAVKVLTSGVAGQDFAKGAGSSTCEAATLSAGGTCTESVTFTPTVPGQRMGAVVLLSAGGQVLGTGYISGTGTGGLGVLAPGNMSTVAGVLDLYTGVIDGGPATKGELDLPAGVAFDGAGNLYIADSLHNRIRLVCSTTPPAYVSTCSGAGTITTIAGNGNPSDTGDGAVASKATLSSPNGIAVDGAGNVYIADTGNDSIRVITAATGNISTIAGNIGGTVCGGSTDSVGDGCAATQATLNQPWGVTVDGGGNVYIADTNNHRVREVSVTTGIITTLAGTGFATPNGAGAYNGDNIPAITAELNYPHAVAFDSLGNMYIPDTLNNRVRKVAAVGGAITPASVITTFAGTGAGIGYDCNVAPVVATLSPIHTPSGLAIDAADNVYISDTENNSIRKVNASSGMLSTVLESGCGQSYNGTAFVNNVLYGPMGMILDGNGNLFFADYFDMVIREVQGNLAVINYNTPVRQGSKSAAVNQTVENDGNAPLDVTAITKGTNSLLGAATTCTTGLLSVANDCTIAAIFAPTTFGNPLIDNIDIAGNTVPGIAAPDSPLDIELVGSATAVNSTNTIITGTPNPSGFGQQVNFTVTVTTGTGTGNLTGTVSVTDTFNGTTSTIAPSLNLNLTTAGTTLTGTASFTTSTLAVGKHSIVATYNTANDPQHFSSTSTPFSQTVQEGTATTVVSSANPSSIGQNVVFTATVVISGGGGVVPDGTITFMDGTNTLGTRTASQVGLTAVASFSTSTLTNGVHAITAVYSGDLTAEIAGNTSPILNQDVQAPGGIVLSSSANPANFGNLVTFTATLNSTATTPATGTVTFLDGATQIGTGTLSGSPATATFGLNSLAVGNHPITATYPGDQYNAPAGSGAALPQVISQATTSTTVSATPNPGLAGASVAITATIKVTAGVSTPTGNVTFTSGLTVLGSAALNSNTLLATINPILAPGNYTIVATYTGDTNDAGSTSVSLPYTVVQATTNTTVVAVPSPGIVTAPITFSATVTSNGGTPTGAVNFLANGSAIGSGNLNASGVATFATSSLAVGSYSITAQYLGDTDDAASTSAAFPETVAKVPTSTSLGTASTGGSTPQVILVASVTNTGSGPAPSGTVTFMSGSTQLGSATLDASGVATVAPNLITGVNYSVVANYLGDPQHAPSSSQAVAITGTATDFQISVAPPTISMTSSQNVTVTVNLTSSGGFSDTIAMGCGGLPVGITCHFSPSSVKVPANGTGSTQLTIDTNSPLTGGLSASNKIPGKRGIAMAGLLLPISALFGWLFWRLRERYAGSFMLGIVLLLSLAALLVTGCSGISYASAAPGTYVIEVTGVGSGSNVIHFGTITVTVTK